MTSAAINKLYTALVDGVKLTPKQIMQRYKVVNPRDLVYRLRREGLNIVLETQVTSKGKVTRRYTLAD